MKRYRGQVKDAVKRSLSNGNITDIGEGGVDVTIPKEDIREPVIHHGSGGTIDRVFPGNKGFRTGDKLKKPPGGGGGGSGEGEASDDGVGEDEFSFHISEEEFLEYLYEDLELPNMDKETQTDSDQTERARAGFVSQGPYSQLDLVRSKRKRIMRLGAAKRPYNDKILELLTEQVGILDEYNKQGEYKDTQLPPKPGHLPKSAKIKRLQVKISGLKSHFNEVVSPDDAARIAEIDVELDALEGHKKRIPRWNESTDLRFRHHEERPIPISKAVMFCLMDVSGSMDQETKDKAKLFYWMLYNFLQRQYKHVDTVFVRHHTEAEEVNEEDFFYKKETGGTMVSSALEK